MSNEPPLLVILGGINGAGKSSVVRVMAKAAILVPVIFLDPDKVTAEILATRPELAAAAANFAGLRFVSQEIIRLLETHQPFMTESVLANNAYRRICLDAKARGWIVRLLYIGVPTVEDAIARVALRVAKGGHHVPQTDICRRWPLTHKNLAWFAQHADAVDVFANTWDAEPKLVAHARAGRVALLDADTLPAVTQVLRPLT